MGDNLARDAERVVLGSMMLDPSVIDAVTSRLRSSDFADLRHGSIFATITAQHATDADTGPVGVALALQGVGELQRVGGAPYLHDLITAVPTTANATWYADQIAAAAKTRTAVEDATRLLQVARSGDADQLGAEQARLVERWSAVDGQGATDSWAPMDLDPFLAGEVEPIAPAIGLRRRDGLRLLYPGKEHAVIGEMECGKTWFCAACAAAEIEAGNHVVYIHFEEPDAADLIGRLRALGISTTAILKRLRFVAPVEQVNPVRLARLLDPSPSLVIFDGVNEGMSLHRWGIREEDGAAMFRRHLIAPCLRIGAATLGCDHVIKDTEKRGRYAIGSIHKGNGITGSLILLENVEAFGRGARGRSHVFVTKDRPGQLRQHGRPDGRTSGKTFMGELVVDDSQTTSPELELIFWPPKKLEAVRAPEASPEQVLEHRVLEAVREITAKGKTANKAAIRAKVPYRATDVDRVLTLLVLDDRLVEAPGRGVERRYAIPNPSGDQLSISCSEAPETRPEPAVLQRDGRTGSWDGPLDPSRTDPDGSGRDQQRHPTERPPWLLDDMEEVLLQAGITVIPVTVEDFVEANHAVHELAAGLFPRPADELPDAELKRLQAESRRLMRIAQELHLLADQESFERWRAESAAVREWKHVEPGRGRPGVGRAVVTVSYNPHGWRVRKSNQSGFGDRGRRGFEICNSVFDGIKCENPIVWQIETHENSRYGTHWLCDEHFAGDRGKERAIVPDDFQPAESAVTS